MLVLKYVFTLATWEMVMATLSEEHFENSKTRRDTYLLLELFIFVQIVESRELVPIRIFAGREKMENYCVALEYVLPVHRNPLELGLRTF
jgi:hypothetical protein